MEQRILKIKVSNIKAVRNIEIHADPHMNELSGPNEAGKTSVLDSIRWAFSGKKAIDAQIPVRLGQDEAEIIIETDDYIISRMFTDGGEKTTLRVTSKEDGSGRKQGDLNELYNTFTFDPLAFKDLKPAQQINVLLGLAGEEFQTALMKLDSRISGITDERRLRGRAVKNFGNIAKVEKVERKDVSELMAEITNINSLNQQRAMTRQQRVSLQQRIDDSRERYVALQAELERLKEQGTNLVNQLKGIPEPDADQSTDDLQSSIDDSSAMNRQAVEYDTYIRRCDEKKQAEDDFAESESELKAHREQRKELVESVQLPIDGVNFSEDGLIVDGVPFDQLSSGRQIRVSTIIGMSQAPALRIMFVQNGSLLDHAGFNTIRELAVENNIQLWVETVGDGHDGDAIHIDGGEIVVLEETDDGLVKETTL